jgi:hypothetical protein
VVVLYLLDLGFVERRIFAEAQGAGAHVLMRLNSPRSGCAGRDEVSRSHEAASSHLIQSSSAVALGQSKKCSRHAVLCRLLPVIVALYFTNARRRSQNRHVMSSNGSRFVLPCNVVRNECECIGPWDVPGTFEVEVRHGGSAIAVKEAVVTVGDCSIITESVVFDLKQ